MILHNYWNANYHIYFENKSLNYSANIATTFTHSENAMSFLFKRAESVRATVDVIIMCYCSLRYQRVGLLLVCLPKRVAEVAGLRSCTYSSNF